MSIIGSFVGALMALAARARPEETGEQIVGLKIDLEDARRVNERLKREVERLERRYMATWNELAAERERAALWRQEAVRPRHERPLSLPLGGQHAVNDWRQLGQAAQNAQYFQQVAAQAQCFQHGLAQQLGAQGVNWPHCDCTPTRQGALTGRAERLTNP
jgi:hypothetical protein